MNLIGMVADTLLMLGMAHTALVGADPAHLYALWTVLGYAVACGAWTVTAMRNRRLCLRGVGALTLVDVAALAAQVNFLALIMTAIGLSIFMARRWTAINNGGDHDRQHIRLLVDLLPMGLTLLFDLSSPGVTQFAATLFACAAVCRLVAMRTGAIALARQQGAAGTALRRPMMLLGAVLVAVLFLFFHFAVVRSALLWLGLAAFLLLVVLSARRRDWIALFLALLLLPLLLLLKPAKRRPSRHSLQTPHGLQKHFVTHHSAAFPAHSVETWLIVLALLLFAWWIWRRSSRLRALSGGSGEPGEPVISHRRIQTTRAQRRKRSPLAQLFVQCVRDGSPADSPRNPGDTARELIARVRRAHPSNALRDLLVDYEGERYGEARFGAERVAALRADLARDGVLQRGGKR